MPQSKAKAKARAKRLHIPVSHVVKATGGKGGYYIAPRGVDSSAGKHAYAEARSRGKSKGYSARVAHTVEKKHERHQR